jgi:hypothetical protein
MKKICSVDGCRRRSRLNGLCAGHDMRRREGRPLEGKIRKCVHGSLAKRLKAYTKQDPKTGCLLWTGHRDPGGYGRMGVDHTTTRSAHRVAWEIAHGSIPEGMLVLHTCDNPRCCNPEHLKLGTHADNMRQKAERGRGKGAKARDREEHPQWEAP